jgi:hypothetical protein
LPLGESVVVNRDPLPCLAALGTGRQRVRGGPDLGVRGGVLFQEEGGQFLAQVAGTVFPLGEGDKLVLVLGSEHAVKGGGGVGEPLLTQLAAGVRGRGRTLGHGDRLRLGNRRATVPGILSSCDRRRNGFAPGAS